MRIGNATKLLNKASFNKGQYMKLPYFKISEAFKEAKFNFEYGGAADKLSSTAALLGKTVANVGMFAVEASIEIAKGLPEAIGKQAQKKLDENSGSMSPEEIDKCREAVERGKEARQQREATEREERLRKNEQGD